MNYWVVNTDEGESEGRGADEKMIQASCVAAWKDPSEGPEWAKAKLGAPEAGDRVFLYRNGSGVIAMATFDHAAPVPSNDIFGLQHRGEFSRKVIDLNARPKQSLSCTTIETHTGKSFNPRHTVFRIKIPEIAEFLERGFSRD